MIEIENLCDMAGCSKKIRKVHEVQYRKGWNPHPSDRFRNWWSYGYRDTEKETGRAWEGIDAVRAYNCEAVREVYRIHLKKERDERDEHRI